MARFIDWLQNHFSASLRIMRVRQYWSCHWGYKCFLFAVLNPKPLVIPRVGWYGSSFTNISSVLICHFSFEGTFHFTNKSDLIEMHFINSYYSKFAYCKQKWNFGLCFIVLDLVVLMIKWYYICWMVWNLCKPVPNLKLGWAGSDVLANWVHPEMD